MVPGGDKAWARAEKDRVLKPKDVIPPARTGWQSVITDRPLVTWTYGIRLLYAVFLFQGVYFFLKAFHLAEQVFHSPGGRQVLFLVLLHDRQGE